MPVVRAQDVLVLAEAEAGTEQDHAMHGVEALCERAVGPLAPRRPSCFPARARRPVVHRRHVQVQDLRDRGCLLRRGARHDGHDAALPLHRAAGEAGKALAQRGFTNRSTNLSVSFGGADESSRASAALRMNDPSRSSTKPARFTSPTPNPSSMRSTVLPPATPLPPPPQ